ncbi:glycosyl hydrolase catalytic core-domain-containing protein [Trametes meyenii]|nr:glycosyl hydrolase catalytic core-domain-containing protein [Trametes meyenii]
MASKLLNLVALSSLAIMACTYGVAPTTALSTGHLQHANRHLAHAPIAAKKKRDQSKRCKARPSTSAAPTSSVKPQAAAVSSSSEAPAPTTTKAPEPSTTSKAPAPASTTKASSGNSGSSTGSSGSSGNTGGIPFGSKGKKVCLAWGDGNSDSVYNFKTDRVVGIYDWDVYKPTFVDNANLDYWPMLWGGDSSRISKFEQTVTQKLGSTLLGFNEPNEPGQSNMDAGSAAALYRQHITSKKSMGYKLASPAMSSRPNGQQWMTDFFNACGDDKCGVDFQAVHWYDIGFDKLQSYLEDYHNRFGLPIMLTEFADQNFNGGAQASMSDIYAFMAEFINWAENTDWIIAYCPFGVMKDLPDINQLNKLEKSDGTPTDLAYMVLNGPN